MNTNPNTANTNIKRFSELFNIFLVPHLLPAEKMPSQEVLQSVIFETGLFAGGVWKRFDLYFCLGWVMIL